MSKNNAAGQVQDFLKTQLEEAQKRFGLLETEAEKALKNLALRGKQTRKELEVLLEKLDGVEIPDAKSVRQIGKRAEKATSEVKKRLDGLQAKVIEASGVASQSQVKELSRELGRLSKKLDGLVGAKKAAVKPEPRA